MDLESKSGEDLEDGVTKVVSFFALPLFVIILK